MNKHSIVLNGKRYDAITGALLGPVESTQVPKSSKTAKPPVSHTLRDGASIPRTNSATAAKAKQRKHPAPVHIAPHKPQGGKTLMRRAVKKPFVADIVPVKRQYPLQPTDSGVVVAAPQVSIGNVDPARLKRANAAHKSSQIGRFITQATSPIRPKVAPITVAAAPVHSKQHKSTVASASSHPQNIFEHALATAASHETKYHAPAKKSHKKAFRVTAGIVSVLLIGSFFVFTSRHSIELQIASWQAGFNASAPSYVPSGYQKEATDVEGKSVSINYVSPEDSTMYSLTQEPSDWNSQTLLSTIVAQASGTYRVLENNGRTIYIYDGNKAAWVDGGVLYTIAGSAPLSADQITSIASSL